MATADWSSALGPRLRTLRRQRGLTIKELARRAGLHEISISRMERGVVLPSAASVHAITSALGVPVERLYGFESKTVADAQARARGEPVGARVTGQPWIEVVPRMRRGQGRPPVPGWTSELLTSPNRGLQASIHSYAAGLEVWHSAWTGDEWGLVLAGEFEFVAGGEVHRAGEGDSFSWTDPPDLLIRSVGSETGRILYVVSYPEPPTT